MMFQASLAPLAAVSHHPDVHGVSAPRHAGIAQSKQSNDDSNCRANAQLSWASTLSRARGQRLPVVLCLMLIFTATVAAPTMGAPEVTGIFRSAVSSLNSVCNYEFTVVERATIRGETMTSQATFYQAGSMFRTESSFFNGNGNVQSEESPDTIMAFNGERYQNYDRAHDALSFSRKNRFPSPYYKMNPLMLPYIWLWPRLGATWSDLRSPTVWSTRTTQAELLPQEVLRSFVCDTIRLPYVAVGADSHLTVYLAKDLGHYPIRVVGSIPSQDTQFTIDVVDHLAPPVDESIVVFPTAIQLRERRGREKTAIDWQVNEQSVRINHPIPEELFTISPRIAKIVDDYDRNMARLIRDGLVQPPVGSLEPPQREEGARKWVLPVNIIVIVLLTVLVIFRRHKRLQHFSG